MSPCLWLYSMCQPKNGDWVKHVLIPWLEDCMHAAFVTPWTIVRQFPLSMDFSRKEYWSGLPLPTPGNLSHPGIEPTSPELAGRSFTIIPPGKRLEGIKIEVLIRLRKWKLLSHVWLFATSLSSPTHGLYSTWNSPGQNTRVGSHSLLQGNLPNPEIKSRSPTFQADSLSAEPQGKPKPSFKYLWRHHTQLTSVSSTFSFLLLKFHHPEVKTIHWELDAILEAQNQLIFTFHKSLLDKLIENHPKFEVKKYVAR